MAEKTVIAGAGNPGAECFHFREDYLFFGLLVRHGLCAPSDHAGLVRAQRALNPPMPLAEMLAEKSNLSDENRRDIAELLGVLANPKLADLLPAEFSGLRTLVPRPEETQQVAPEVAPTVGLPDAAHRKTETDHGDEARTLAEDEFLAGLMSGSSRFTGGESASYLSEEEMTRVARAAHKGQLIGELLHGHVVIDRLGGGGQGDVYLAKQVSLNRYVALKKLEIPPYASPGQFLEMFRREARTLGAINHARIVKVYEIFEEDGIAFFTMEFLKGRALSDLVKESGGGMPLDVVANLACQACSALGRTAEDGLVHRDIKPANMMLDENGDLKIVDFGLATAAAAFKKPGAFSGTPHYASPEQARLDPLTPASDQYSLGVTLFYALTGCLPFEATTASDMLEKHIKEMPPSPSSLNPQLPPSVDRVLLRMMEKEPGRRFATFDDCFSAWEEILQAESRGGAAATSQLLGDALLRFGKKERESILRRSVWLTLAWLLLVTGTVLGEYRLRSRGLGWFLDACGVWGTVLLSFSLGCIFYVALARRRWVPIVGSLRAWLYTHIATAVPAVAMLLVHSGYFVQDVFSRSAHSRPWLSVLMASTLLVTAISGSVGLVIFRQLRRRLQLEGLELRGARTNPREAMLMVLGARFLAGWRLVHYPLAVFFILLSLAHILHWLRFRV
jgi:hypothetical protein